MTKKGDNEAEVFGSRGAALLHINVLPQKSEQM